MKRFSIRRGFANEGGYWAEVPAIPGCATEGDSWDESIANLHEAIEGCLSVDRSHRSSRLPICLSTQKAQVGAIHELPLLRLLLETMLKKWN
jgi:predicted RNase H-like HicB family nuclease